jgi:hypothetical protein
MTNIQQLENELWEAADQLRANSKLTAAEYAMPVLGLIFLRHADNRFSRPPCPRSRPPSRPRPAKQREELIKLGLQGKAAIYLPEQARFDRIASLPEGAKIGEIIDGAMDRIEADYEVLGFLSRSARPARRPGATGTASPAGAGMSRSLRDPEASRRGQPGIAPAWRHRGSRRRAPPTRRADGKT